MVENLFPTNMLVSRIQRSRQKNQKSTVVWLTGLSGAGKSTIAFELDKRLTDENYHSYVLDGDNIRAGLNKDLDFSDEGRHENIRRIGELAKLLADAGILVLVAFISPFRSDRTIARKRMPSGEFIEVYVKASLETCRARDPKHIYQKAAAGRIEHFTGLSSIYEEPEKAEIMIDTEKDSPQESVNLLYGYLKGNGFLDRP